MSKILIYIFKWVAKMRKRKLITGFVAAHEAGHYVVAKALGVNPRRLVFSKEEGICVSLSRTFSIDDKEILPIIIAGPVFTCIYEDKPVTLWNLCISENACDIRDLAHLGFSVFEILRAIKDVEKMFYKHRYQFYETKQRFTEFMDKNAEEYNNGKSFYLKLDD